MARSHLSGTGGFGARINAITAKLQTDTKQAVKKAVLKTEASAKQLTPVDTGYLRNSISSSFSEGGMEGKVGVGAEYGIYVEYGTSKQHEQPFMTPAFVTNKEAFLDDMERIARKVAD
ncbi:MULTISPECIES: HK97-gp10 family putative phage morphogenesis protein [Gammaproteobacteria]|uniref:HK97-gp10 family putative phage morphogenesis protein n=1 Tax=Acinetobacter sp. HRXRD-152 TaxID=3404808 RepID=UPI003BB5D1FB